MALMSVEEWRKKKEEKKQGTSVSSAPSAASTGSSSDGSSGKSSQLMTVEQWRAERAKKSANGWAKEAQSLLEENQRYFSSWRSKDDEGYKSIMERNSALLAQADSWRKQYAGNEEAISYIDEVVSALNKASNYAYDHRKYYSQWETFDDYNKYVDQQKDYEEKSKYDIESGQKEIDVLEEELRKLRTEKKGASYRVVGNSYLGSPYAAAQQTQQAQREVDPTDARIGELEKQISQKKQYLNQAKHIQEGITLSGVVESADFDEYSGYVSTKTDDRWGKLLGKEYDETYEYINNQNGIRDEIKQKHRNYSADNPFDDGESSFEEKGYDYLTENEIAIYNYYYAKDGKKKAQEYLENIQETLNHRKATSMYKNMEDKTALELAFGVAAGIDQWESGTKNLFNTKDDYIAQTAYQIASGMVREDLADDGPKLPKWLGGASLGQVGYDAITTTANMAPSMLTSMAANMIAPGSGAVVGNAMMFASSAGNAYQEALNLGYDKNSARAYSTLVGASEAGLQYLMGGISSLGGKVSGSALNKMLNGIDNAFARTALKIGGNMVSEGLEEGLQEVLTPLFKNWTLMADEDINWSEVAYSGLLGALTAGFMEGPAAIGSEVKTYGTGKQLKKEGITATRLAEIGKTFAADTVAYQLAGRVNENTGAYTLGRLFNEIGATLTEQNVSEIAEALVAKGMGEMTAKKNAQALAYVVEGGQLTEKQVAVIEANEVLAEVARTTLIDANSTVNQRTKGYNEALMALAKEKASPKTAEAGTADAGKENAPVSDKVDGENKIASEGSSEVDTSPAKVGSITAIKNRMATIKLEDGSEVSARDADLSPEDGVRIETIAKIDGISATDANAVLGILRAATGASAQMDSLGATEAYNYGRYGFSKEHMTKNGVFANSLTEDQRQAIYEIGQRARQQQVASKQSEIEKTVKEAQAALAQESAEGTESRDRKYMAVLDDGITALSLNESQKASYRLADQVAEAAKVNIRVYLGKTGEHGYYNPKTDEIYLNLNATNKSRKSMMAFTLGHELVHRAKKGSPAKYEAFANFLIEQYGKQGSSVEAMIAEELAAAKEFGIEMTYEKAFEEVVCNACQRMLLDTDAGQKLAEFGAQSKQNKSFLEDVKRWIMDFLDKLRSIFQNVEPDSLAAKEFAKFDESVKQILADMYVDMTIDAGENLSTIQNAFGKDTVVETNEHGEFTMASSKDSSEKLFNLVTWKNGGRETLEATLLREGYTEDEVKAALTIMDEKQRLVESIANEVDGNGKLAFPEQGRINEATLTTDLKDGHSVLSALVSNGDYPVNIDLLMVCKKRKAYQRVINRLCETGLIQQATVDALAIAEINKILGKYGFETACLGCFVESRRLRIQEWAQTICKEWNAEVKKRNPNAKAFGFGKGEATLTPDEVMKIIGELESGGEKNDKGNLNLGQGSAVKRMGVLLDKVPSLQRTLSIEDLITPDGLSSLRSFDSNLFSMVKSRYGSNSPKFVQEFNPYNHELAKYGKVPTQYESLREYLYAIGGARMQSFSDFIIENWFDYCQIVADLAARKLPMHTYTKEIALAKLFGLTGIKINMSLIPDVDRSLSKEFAGLTRNSKGELELIWADKDRFKATGGKSYMQSINFADAVALQNDPRYSANVGTIAVGISDKHIEVMLGDARIRMIIPYHSSGMNPIFADLMGTSYYKDYTNFQNTTIKQIYNSKGQPVSLKLEKAQNDKLVSGFQFNEVLQDLGDARAAAEAYKEWCADASKHTITIKGETYTAELTPKFNDFSGHQNYYKLLEDFNTYDCISEQAARQGDVQQIYPEDFDKILKAELSAQERHRQKQETNQAFDKAMGEIESYLKDHSKADTIYYAQQHGIKLSKKDSKLDAAEKAKLKKLQEEGASFSLPRSEPAPTFYSHMARVVDGVKQEKLGASSVVSMLRGKGVKAEEIKWSGIEAWLDGKKSVTKAELQEFIAGSMLQIEEETLDNKDRPYTEDQQKRLDEYEAKRDEVAKRLAAEWKKITGEEFPVRNPGAGLESTVVNKIIDANKGHKDATFEGRLLKKLRNDLKEVIANNDDFGFDSWKDALRSIHRHRRDFISYYEMSANDKAVIVKYCNALNAYNELPNLISDADTDRLRAIALETDPWTRKIMEVKHEHNEEEAKYMTNWGQYTLKGGRNYREILFRIPGSTYTNEAMMTHWKERKGVLAHARIQDMDTFIGKMLFIEEIQSDWHNEGHKSGYRDPKSEDKYTLSKKMEKYTEEFFASPIADVVRERIGAIGYEGTGVSMILNFLLDSQESMKSTLNMLSRKGASFTESEINEITEYAREYEKMYHLWQTAPGDLTAPDAPFKDTYHEYVLKRLLREAAENGYDSIGWTTAETQDERWANNRPHKEGEGKSGFLKGYTIEYDQDIPKFLNKYGKKWGTKVGKTVLDNGTEVWSMAITDEMNDSVLNEGQVMYSLPRAEAIKPSEEQIESNIQAVAGMQSVHDVDASKLDKSGKKLWDIFEEQFASWDYNIHSDTFGDVAAKNSSIRSELRHGFTPVKIASIEAIPDVIKSGKIVGWIEKNNGTLFRIVVAAPITIGETPYIMGVMLQRDDQHQRLYLHDVVIEKEASDFSQDDLVSTGSSESENLYMTSILQKVLDVKLNRDYKLPVGEDTSPRALLSNAFETIVTNPIEKRNLQEYKKNISMLNEEEAKLHELREQIKDLSFAKGPKDTKKIRALQFEANQAANRIATLDKILLRFEASAPLQGILQREKELVRKRAEKKNKEALEAYRERAAKTQRELLDRWQESRKRGIDSRQRTAMRHKIKDVVNELNQYLLKGTKDRHVPIGLQKAVAEALNAVNMDTVGAEERIAKLQADLMKAKSPDEIQEISKKIDNIREMGDRLDEKLKRLKTAYDEFINSDDPLIANAHDDAVSAHMMRLIVRVGDTPLREMTLDQLQDVYDVYKVVLATIRNANKSFKDNKNREISTRANQVMAEIDNLGVKRGKKPVFMSWIEKFGWDGLKPVYAMEHIGSKGLIDAYNNVRAGEDTWAQDIVEAREYYLEKFRKYKYDSWDFDKKHQFTSTTKKDFELTLDQIMSLYAYSKRDQAADHLKFGGIVFDPKTEVVEKTKSGIKVKYNVANATAYNISEETLADIISTLTDDQKGFVDEMQAYLSDVMGAKGNEVSLAMYDVKLFREKHYFPLKSAHQYMAKAKEQAQGDVKIKNSGFSKETKPHAKNPIVLSSFMDVWSNHVNEMSMYHAFVLPMEDFYRIYNYTTPSKDEKLPTEGVNPSIENAYGIGATEYIEQMLKDLNGGARSDSRTGFINKMMGLFKKGSVFASLSVVVQQPSAIARAAALVDTKYFIGPKVDHKRHKALWEEVKQYAPVAIIKEMGYFDTNMGKSTQDFIMGQEYSGFSEKMKALVADSNYRDEVLSKAPALADELAWCSIWEAVKRETKDANPSMDVTSEAFLEKAGERFTEVIVKTQVYDSVLSRSAMMRSKDTGMKMATAFMAEPTTSINMVADALLKGKRGDRKYARTAIGAVIASQIINSILVSFVYAGRDDDEDETYVEKYIGTLTGEILDGLNPATYIPFIKDIVSIVKGYDVERSDMAVVSDLVKAWQNLSKDNVSVYRKVEGFAGSVAQIFGLPVKNIMRDTRAFWQTAIQPIIDKQKGVEREPTTGAGIKYAVKGAIPKWMGGGDVSDQQQLYEAIISGDKEHISRVKGRFNDQNAINSAIRNALRENDPRIHEAAIAWNANDLDEYMRIAKQIIAEKHFVQDDVVMAIRSEANKLTPDDGETSTSKAKGLFTAEKFAAAISQNDQATAYAIKTDIIQTAQKNGKTAEEAEKSFNSSAKSALKETFLAGDISEQKAIDALVTFCGAEEKDAQADVQYWAFKQDYPDVHADDSWFDAYYEKVVDSGIGIDVYMEYRNTVVDITGEGKKERRMDVINSLPITKAQKDALYFAEGWAASNLYQAPWH